MFTVQMYILTAVWLREENTCNFYKHRNYPLKEIQSRCKNTWQDSEKKFNFWLSKFNMSYVAPIYFKFSQAWRRNLEAKRNAELICPLRCLWQHRIMWLQNTNCYRIQRMWGLTLWCAMSLAVVDSSLFVFWRLG